MLNEIESRLKGFGLPVYYGLVDDVQKKMVWDYFVFNRRTMKHPGNKVGVSEYFDVHIIRENYIPEGVADEVIGAICSIPGVRRTAEDCTFQYAQKPNTNVVLELLTIPFVRARK